MLYSSLFYGTIPTRILYTRRLQCNKKIIRFKLALLHYYQIYYITVRYAIQVPLGDTYSCSYVCIHITSHSVRRNLHHTQLINMRDTIILTFTAGYNKYICRYTLANILYKYPIVMCLSYDNTPSS